MLIGYYDRGKLIYAGSVGTGWSIQLGGTIIAAYSGSAATPPPRPAHVVEKREALGV
jgi:hypothetical protein